MTTESTRLNRAAFYDKVRDSLFRGSLTTAQVQNIDAILDACEECSLWERDPMFPAYILATVRGEVGSDMAPVREGFKETDAAARKYVRELYNKGRISSDYASRHANGNSYYGRGYVQLTHGDNYKRMGQRLGLDLYKNPDLALDPKVAAKILVVGCMEGLFTGVGLDEYLPEAPRAARQVVNGLDRADEFADYARKFERGISGALRDKPSQKVAEPSFWAYLLEWIMRLLKGGKP